MMEGLDHLAIYHGRPFRDMMGHTAEWFGENLGAISG
jgi:hypothetical protein